MRAAASSEGPRARNRQSQRATRRSLALPPAPTVFHPQPSQSGQISAGAFTACDPSFFDPIIFKPILLFRLCTQGRVPRKPESLSTCVHPVNQGCALWRAEEIPATAIRKPPGWPQFGPNECKTGFRRGFSQLTFATDGGEYEPSGFPTQSEPIFCQSRLGMKRDLRG